MQNVTKLSEKAFKIIRSYQNLDFYSKKVVCPYFINIKKTNDLRSLVGKGTAQEIMDEVKIWAKVMKFDLEMSSENEIRKFMLDKGIGIDCSGYVTYILNEELKFRGLPSISKLLKYKDVSLLFKIKLLFREIQNVSAELLTSTDNCNIVTRIEDIAAGDLMRFYGLHSGMHVAIVTETYIESNKKIIHYTHSSRWYNDENGVRFGIIKFEVSDGYIDLEQAIWQDVDKNGTNWIRDEYMNHKEDSGFRKLKILNKL